MNDDTRLDCSDMPKENKAQKVCPIMSRPIPTDMSNDRGYHMQMILVKCRKEQCAVWIEEHCGLMANIVKIEAAPKVEIGPVQRERPRSGIGSDPIVNKSKE